MWFVSMIVDEILAIQRKPESKYLPEVTGNFSSGTVNLRLEYLW